MKKASFILCKIKDIVPETADSVSIYIEVPDENKEDFKYKPGQYLTLKTWIGDQEIRRSYSLSTAPHQNKLRIGVKQVEGGKMSTYLNKKAKIGDLIEVMRPMGNFIIDSHQKDKQYVFFAAGSGITPTLSMIIHLLETTSNQVILFYGNRGVDMIMYREEIEGLKNRYMNRFVVYHVFSREKLGSPLFKGRINAEKCKQFHDIILQGVKVEEYFICGPSTMIFDVKDSLLNLGVPKEKIKFELFTTDDIENLPEIKKESNVDIENDEKTARTKIKLDGKITEINIPFNGKPILVLAEELGIDVPYSCKGGVCSTCKAKLIEGKVKMEVNYALEEDELEEGYILTCQSHPLTEYLYIDYDQG